MLPQRQSTAAAQRLDKMHQVRRICLSSACGDGVKSMIQVFSTYS